MREMRESLTCCLLFFYVRVRAHNFFVLIEKKIPAHDWQLPQLPQLPHSGGDPPDRWKSWNFPKLAAVSEARNQNSRPLPAPPVIPVRGAGCRRARRKERSDTDAYTPASTCLASQVSAT